MIYSPASGCRGKSKLTQDLQDDRQALAGVRARLLAQALCIPPAFQDSCHGSLERPSFSQPATRAAARRPQSKLRCTTAPLPDTRASHTNTDVSRCIDLSAHLHNIHQDRTCPMLETRWFAALPASPSMNAFPPCIAEEPEEHHRQGAAPNATADVGEGDPLVLMSSAGLNSSIAPNTQSPGNGIARPYSSQERPARGAVLYHAALTLDPREDAAGPSSCQRSSDGRTQSVSGVCPNSGARINNSAGGVGTSGARGGGRAQSASSLVAGMVCHGRRPDSGCSVSAWGSSRPSSSSMCRQGVAPKTRTQHTFSAQRQRLPAQGVTEPSLPPHTATTGKLRAAVPEASITSMLLRERQNGHLKGAATPRHSIAAPAGAKWQGGSSIRALPGADLQEASFEEVAQSRNRGRSVRQSSQERPKIPTAVQGRHLRTHVLEENIDRRIRSSQRQRAKSTNLASQMARFWSNLERTKIGLRTPPDTTACFNEDLPEWERYALQRCKRTWVRRSISTCIPYWSSVLAVCKHWKGHLPSKDWIPLILAK